jgi:hypothetical protein
MDSRTSNIEREKKRERERKKKGKAIPVTGLGDL